MNLTERVSAKIPRDYPYLNARVRAKGAQLFDRNDYESFLKMEANGIARQLEEGQYSREVNELGSLLDGAELVETALKRNAARTLSDLVEMSPKSLEKILNVYFRRYDIENLKKILRLKDQGEAFERVTTPGFKYSEEDLEQLFEEDFDAIIEAVEFDGLVDYSDYIDGEMSLKEFEKSIDQAYFDELEELAEMTGNAKLEAFIRKELEYQNLGVVLRLKKYGVDSSEIRDRCYHADSSKLVEACTDAVDFEECIDILRDSEWDIGAGEKLEEVEHRLEVSRLRNALKTLRTAPLGLAPVMAFAVAKMVEVENIRIIVQSKATGVQGEEEIRKNLVIAE